MTHCHRNPHTNVIAKHMLNISPTQISAVKNNVNTIL